MHRLFVVAPTTVTLLQRGEMCNRLPPPHLFDKRQRGDLLNLMTHRIFSTLLSDLSNV
jgi:hypothetical protein